MPSPAWNRQMNVRAPESGKVTSMDVVEVNPILDVKNGTAALAVDLVGSLMGRRIIGIPE